MSPASKQRPVGGDSTRKQQLPGVWPGVWMTSAARLPNGSDSPSVSQCSTGRTGRTRQPNIAACMANPSYKKRVVPVQRDGAARRLLDVARLVDVIEVRVRVDDPFHRQIVVAHDLEDALMLAARIDDDRLLGVGAGEHRAVALERADGECLEEQHQGLVAWNEPVSTVAMVCPFRDSTRLDKLPVIFAATCVKVIVPPSTTDAS